MQFSTKNFKSQSNFLTLADNCSNFPQENFYRKNYGESNPKIPRHVSYFQNTCQLRVRRFSKFLTI